MMNRFTQFGITLFICIVVPLFSMAQSVQKSTYIQGSINLDDRFEAVLNFVEKKSFEEKNLIVPISKLGKFNFKFPAQKQTFVKITIIPKDRKQQLAINFPLYIKPGSKNNFQLHYNDTAYLSIIKGNLNGNNLALLQYSNFRFLKMKEWFLNPPTTMGLKPALYQYFDKANELVKKHKVNVTAVKNYLDIWAMNDYIDNLLSQSNSNRDIKISSSFFDMKKSPASIYNLPQSLLFNETFRCLKEYINIIDTVETASNSSSDIAARKMKLVNRLFTNPAIKLLFNSNELAEYTRKFRLNDNSNFDQEKKKFEVLAENITDADKKNELINNFANLQYTMHGAPIPPIAFKDLNGNTVALSSFKGKYIYIDMWASWCIPCIGEIPHLKKLEDEYKDKNIVFLSISTDEDKTAWKNKVKELNLHGNQLETGNSGFEKIMNIQAIPHFILYDASGKLMYYKAPRPSTTEIRTLFNTIQ